MVAAAAFAASCTVALVVFLAACFGIFGGGQAFLPVEEGQVACTYLFGRLDNEVLRPGNHFLLAPPPPARQAIALSVRSQTTTIVEAECSSSDGVAIPIPKIELVHQLIATDVLRTLRAHGADYTSFLVKQLRAEVVQLCSYWPLSDIVIHRYHEFDDVLQSRLRDTVQGTAPDMRVQVHQLRVSRPRVPAQIGKAFGEVEKLRRSEEAESGRLDKLSKAAEAERRREVLAAYKEADISRMAALRAVERAESRLTEQQVAIRTMRNQKRAQADADMQLARQQARSMGALLSPAYLALARAQQLPRRMKAYLGSGIPRAIMVEDDGPRGVHRGPTARINGTVSSQGGMQGGMQGGIGGHGASESGVFGDGMATQFGQAAWEYADLEAELAALMQSHTEDARSVPQPRHGSARSGSSSGTGSGSGSSAEGTRMGDRWEEDEAIYEEVSGGGDDFTRRTDGRGMGMDRGQQGQHGGDSNGGGITTQEVLQTAGKVAWAALEAMVN